MIQEFLGECDLCHLTFGACENIGNDIHFRCRDLEIRFSARINHGGDNVVRKEYGETYTSSQSLQSLGGHRRRPLGSFWVYMPKAKLAVGKNGILYPEKLL